MSSLASAALLCLSRGSARNGNCKRRAMGLHVG
jgi:hypothetical protein